MDFTEQTFRTWLRMHDRNQVAGFAGQPTGCIMHSFLNDLPGIDVISVSGKYWLDSDYKQHDLPEWATGVVRAFDSVLSERLHKLEPGTAMELMGRWREYAPVTFGQFARRWDPVLVDA
jgi:hypothetical protein